MWNQVYLLWGQGVAVSALIAAIPILVVLILLGILRRPAWIAALSGLIVTFVIAVTAYGMPVGLATSSALYGGAFGLFPICWIVFAALVLFRVSTETGQFDILRDSITRITPDPRLQALLIAFGFGAFLEGAAGFGTPVAIAAAMLAALGFSPFRASAICLLSNTAPVAFGSIGIPVITLAVTTGLPLGPVSAAVGHICPPVSIFIPLYLIFVLGGVKNCKEVWIPALTSGVVFGVVQWFVATHIGPQLTDILAALASVAATILILKLFPLPPCSAEDAVRFRGSSTVTDDALDFRHQVANPVSLSAGKVFRAWMPYLVLIVCVLLWGYPPFTALLNKASIPVPWPHLHNLIYRLPPVSKVAGKYPAIFNFNYLSASGTSAMIASIISALLLGVRPAQFVGILGRTARQVALPVVTVFCVLAMAFLMNYCGATGTLGLAFASTGKTFPFFAALLGWVGVFLTGSDTSANALFGNLQVVAATRLGINPIWAAAANSSGGVMGKMISLQTIAVAAAATGMPNADQSRVFRFTLKHSVFLACIIGLLALFFTYNVAI